MNKSHPIPDDIYQIRGVHTGKSWCPSVKVGGKIIEAQVEWLSKMSKDATLKEALEVYPGNPRLEHAEGGTAWAKWEGNEGTTVGEYLEDGVDRVMKITLNLSNLGIRSLVDVEGLDKIPRIDELNLSGNQLGDDDVAALTRMPVTDTLQILYLPGNRITSFPTMAFPILHELNLSGNGFKTMIGIEPSGSLESLLLTKNRLDMITRDDIERFPNLIRMSVNENEITEIGDITGITFGAWRSKPAPHGITMQRYLFSQLQFVFSFYGNPIKKIHPKTIILLKNGTKDGSIDSSYELYQSIFDPT